MTPLAQSFSKKTGCGSPNAHHSFGIRNPEKMNFNHQSSVPSGPRSYRGNGGANNGTGNANNGNPNYKGKNFNPNYKGKNYNPNFTRPVPANNGTGNANNGNPNANNGNPNYNNGNPNYNNGNANYKGKKFNPNHKGKNYNQNFTRPLPADIAQARNGNRRRQSNNNHRGLQSQYNIDVQMAEAPSDEPNDIEMPDAPPLPDPRIEAFTLGALAVKEIAETMLALLEGRNS